MKAYKIFFTAFILIISFIIIKFFSIASNNKSSINATFFKISFKVFDNYNNNLSDIKFAVFEDKKIATESITNNSIKSNNVLVSKNGKIFSDVFFEINKEYFLVNITNLEHLSDTSKIYSFKLSTNDNFLIEKIIAKNGDIEFVKEIFPDGIKIINKYKIKIIQLDNFENRIKGVKYNLFSNKNFAEKSTNDETIRETKKLETLSLTNNLGVAISNNFYPEGTYFLVRDYINEKYEDDNKIIEIKIVNGEKNNTIEKSDFYYIKKIDNNEIKLINKYRIKLIDSAPNTYGLFVNKKIASEYIKTQNNALLLEKIDLSNDNIKETKYFYKNGEYFIINITSKKIEEGLTINLKKDEIKNIEKDSSQNDFNNPFYYTKLFYVDKNTNIIPIIYNNSSIPLTVPESDAILKNKNFKVYEDVYYSRYLVYDENNLILGYLNKNDVFDIENYDILGNLKFFTLKINPSTNEFFYQNFFWVLLSFCLILSFIIINKKINIIFLKN